jgi:multiple sugar transport system permease protein
VINSTFRDTTFMQPQWIFLKNYTALFADPAVLQSIRFTLLFMLLSVPLELFFGLMTALLLNERTAIRNILRTCILIPWAIPAAISARSWELIYNYNYGLANIVLSTLGVSSEPINWLGTDIGAVWAVVIADTWRTTPFVALILLAGLSTISEELYEQSRVDGASVFQRFFSITLPLLRGVILVALIFRTIDAVRVFDLTYILTHGGPGGATTSLSHIGYKYFISGDFGFGSALSVVVFCIALVLSILYVLAGRFQQGVAE